MSVWLDLLLDLFFPPKCMFCGALIERSSMVICNDCMLSELPEVERELPKVPYFEKSVPANIHLMFGENDLLYFPGSIQIVKPINNNLLYLGKSLDSV